MLAVAVAERAGGRLGGDLLPYMVFNEVRLERWLEHTLVLLRDSAAENRLRNAAGGMDQTFTRAGFL
jgi:hypothetical protein